MSKLVEKLVNTVIANLNNTSGIGLFNGKMGLTLFLYEYTRYSNNMVYGKIAEQLIDDIYRQVRSDLSPSMLDGIGGIGYGLIYLLNNQFITGDSDDVLCDVDKYLLDNTREILLREMVFPIPVYSSGLYLLSRLSLCRSVEKKQEWINSTIDAGIFFILECVRKKNFKPKLSLLYSMLFVFSKLPVDCTDCNENLVQLQKDLLLLSIDAVKTGSYQDIDIVLMKQYLNFQRKGMFPKEYSYLESLLSSVNIKIDMIEEWNSYLSWYFLYGMEPFFDFSIVNLNRYIERKFADYLYEMDTLNEQFSFLGLILMRD